MAIGSNLFFDVNCKLYAASATIYLLGFNVTDSGKGGLALCGQTMK